MPGAIDLSTMSDADISRLGAQAPAADPKPAVAPIDLSQMSDDQISALQPQSGEHPGMIKGSLRSAEQGLTMGFGDEINAGARSLLGDEKYDDALADERDQMSKFRQDHPYIAAGTEMAGALPTMMAPGLQEYNGMRFLQGAKTAGQAALRSAGVGAGYGAISGFGHGEGGTENRLWNGLQTGAVSGALGAPLGYGGYKLGEMVGGVNAAKKEAGANGNMPSAALNVLGKKFNQDKIDPVADIIEGQMLPQGLRALNPEQMQEAITAYRNGATQDQLAQQFGVSKGSIGRVTNRFDDNTTTPMTMVDRAKMVRPGAGQNLEWRMRGAAATEGDARRAAMENLTDNQLGQYSRLMDAAQKYVGDGADDSIAKAQETLRNSENAAYATAREKEQPFDITPVLDKWNAEIARRGASSDIGAGLKKATDAFYDQKSAANPMGTDYRTSFTPIKNLQRFQDAKSNLDYLIEASKNEGKASPLTGQLLSFKNEVMEPIAESNKPWKLANDTYTGAGDQALQAGGNLKLSLGGKSREIEKQFARYEQQAASPDPNISAAGQAQIDLFRQGLSRAIQDGIQNKGQTNDLARTLVTPAAQRIMTRVLGQKQADAFNNILRQEQTTTSTFNKIRGGSQTEPLGEEIDAGRLPDMIAKYGDILRHPVALAGELVRRGAGKLYAERNAALMEHMSNLDPVQQMNALRSIKNVSQARQQVGGETARWPAILGDVGTGSQAEQQGLNGGLGQSANILPGQDDSMKKKRGGFASGGIADDDSDQGGIMPFLKDNPRGYLDQPPPSEGEIRNQPDPYAGTGGPSMPASLAYSLSGIPEMTEGISGAHNAALNNDPKGMLKGIGETAIGAAPVALSGLSAPIQRGLGKAGAAIAGAGFGVSLGADAADASKRKAQYRDQATTAVQPQSAPQGPADFGKDPYTDLRKQIGDDPKGMALLSQLIQKSHEASSPTDDPRMSSESSQKIRDAANAAADNIRSQIIDRITELKSSHEPFELAHSNIYQALPWLQPLLPFGLASARGMASKMAQNVENMAWKGATRRAFNELEGLQNGAKSWWGSTPSADKALNNIKTATEFQNNYSPPPTFGSKDVLNTVGGASMGAELQALPSQYDLSRTDPDSDAHKRAEKFFEHPLENTGRAAVLGGLGGFSGGHFTPMPGVRAPNAETNVLKGYLDGSRGADLDALTKNVNNGIGATDSIAARRQGISGNDGRSSPATALQSEDVPPALPASRGIGSDAIDNGGLGSGLDPTATAASRAASDKLTALKGPLPGRGIDELPLDKAQKALPAPEATLDTPTRHNLRHDAGVVIKGTPMGGKYKAAQDADNAEVTAGTMKPNIRDAHNTVRGDLQAWIDGHPDVGTIQNSVLDDIIARAAQAHGVGNPGELRKEALKYLGQGG